MTAGLVFYPASHAISDGPIYEPCPIAEDEWLRKQKPWDKPKPKEATR